MKFVISSEFPSGVVTEPLTPDKGISARFAGSVFQAPLEMQKISKNDPRDNCY